MSRKVITIEFFKVPKLKGTILECSNNIDLCNLIIPTKDGVCGLKGNITSLINRTIEKYSEYTIHLFGDCDLTSQEIAEIEYLKGLI